MNSLTPRLIPVNVEDLKKTVSSAANINLTRYPKVLVKV